MYASKLVAGINQNKKKCLISRENNETGNCVDRLKTSTTTIFTIVVPIAIFTMAIKKHEENSTQFSFYKNFQMISDIGP